MYSVYSERILKTRKQRKNNFNKNIIVISWWTILFRPIGWKKQNLAPFLKVEIKMFIEKTIILLVKLLLRCFLVFKIRSQKYPSRIREDTHKKSFFLMVGPLRLYPPYTNGLVVHATFFLSYNSLKRILTIFFHSSNFGLKKPDL